MVTKRRGGTKGKKAGKKSGTRGSKESSEKGGDEGGKQYGAKKVHQGSQSDAKESRESSGMMNDEVGAYEAPEPPTIPNTTTPSVMESHHAPSRKK